MTHPGQSASIQEIRKGQVRVFPVPPGPIIHLLKRLAAEPWHWRWRIGVVGLKRSVQTDELKDVM